MNSSKDQAIVRASVVVDLSPAEAFELFTAGFDRWWPREHHLGKADLANAVLEAREGGRWFERCVDDTECDWGRVLACEPGRRLVLSWQIDPKWQIDPDPSHGSRVEVTFVSDGSKGTRVTLEHSELARHGEGWEAVVKSVGAKEGWPGLLARYLAAGAPWKTASMS